MLLPLIYRKLVEHKTTEDIIAEINYEFAYYYNSAGKVVNSSYFGFIPTKQSLTTHVQLVNVVFVLSLDQEYHDGPFESLDVAYDVAKPVQGQHAYL